MGNWRPSTKEPPRGEWSSEAAAKVLIERLQFSLERAASIALPRARRSGRGGGNSWLLGRGSKSTGAENRNHRLRRALHRIDLGRLNRHLSGETFQIYFFGPRCPEPPTAANQQSAVERMKAIAALAMLMRRPRRHRRRQAHSSFLLHSGPVLRRQIQPTACHGMGARPSRRSASRRWISLG
jgi:hypothetical protein